MNAGDDRDRLGGRSDAQAEGRGEAGPIARYPDDDRGEDLAAHLPAAADDDVARRLAGGSGADAGPPRLRGEPAPPPPSRRDRGAAAPDGSGEPPIYEGATSASAVDAREPRPGGTGAGRRTVPGADS